MFEETGCEECREAWSHPVESKKVLVSVGTTNSERQARLLQCSICKYYWEDNNGSYPSGLSKEDAEKYYGAL